MLRTWKRHAVRSLGPTVSIALALCTPLATPAANGAEDQSVPGHIDPDVVSFSSPATGEKDPQAKPAGEPPVGQPESARKWFVVFSAVNSHPNLKSEELVDRYFNRTMRVFAPEFDDVKTVGDLRDDYLIWPPSLGFGCNLSARWAAMGQAGYSGGAVRTKANDPSSFLFPLHTDFEIKRSAFYANVGLNWYPLRMPQQCPRGGIWPRLRDARPYLGSRLTWNLAAYQAKEKVGLHPLGNFLSLKQRDRWSLISLTANLGLDIPVTKQHVFFLETSYNYFFEEHQDFGGPAFTLGWKYFFR